MYIACPVSRKPFLTFSLTLPDFQGINLYILYLEIYPRKTIFYSYVSLEKLIPFELNGVGVNMTITSPKRFLGSIKMHIILYNLPKGSLFI